MDLRLLEIRGLLCCRLNAYELHWLAIFFFLFVVLKWTRDYKKEKPNNEHRCNSVGRRYFKELKGRSEKRKLSTHQPGILQLLHFCHFPWTFSSQPQPDEQKKKKKKTWDHLQRRPSLQKINWNTHTKSWIAWYSHGLVQKGRRNRRQEETMLHIKSVKNS